MEGQVERSAFWDTVHICAKIIGQQRMKICILRTKRMLLSIELVQVVL